MRPILPRRAFAGALSLVLFAQVASAASPPAPTTASVPDGSGGMFIYHTVNHGGSWAAPPGPGAGQVTNESYILRITSSGEVAAGWPAEGVAPTDGARNSDYAPLLVPGAANSVIVLWVDHLNLDAQIKAQRISDTGVRLWGPGGIALTTGSSARTLQEAIPDGEGGAIVCWIDATLGFGSPGGNADLRAQRITPTGAIATGWPAGGLLITSSAEAYASAQIVTDGAGGLVACWLDYPVTRAQRVTGAGVTAWTPVDSVYVETGSNRAVPVPDGAGGAILVWSAWDIGTNTGDILAQRYDSTGVAQWPGRGVVVCGAAGDQRDPIAVEDGSGGLVASWADPRANPDQPYLSRALYAVRLTSAGTLASGWPANGTLVGDSLGYSRSMVPDSAGGAYLAYDRLRYSVTIVGPDTIRSSPPHLTVQHLAGAGTPAPGWPAAGVEVAEVGSVSSFQLSGPPTPSPAGGLLLAWYGGGASGFDLGIYGQRVDDAGARLWGANGTLLYQAPSGGTREPAVCPGAAGGAHLAWAQTGGRFARVLDGSGAPTGAKQPLGAGTYENLAPPMLADGTGGAFVAWAERYQSPSSIHVRHLDASGAPLWTVSIPAGSLYLRFEGMVRDGGEGVIVAWYDDRTNELMAQRIGASGSPMWWGAGATLIPGFSLGQSTQAALIADGAGGAIVACERWVYGPTTTRHNVFLQRVDSLGAAPWGYEGVAAAPADRDQLRPRLASDGAGGAFVSWGDEVGLDSDVRAQRIDADGQVAAGWPADGLAVCAASGRQTLPDIAPAAGGSAIVAWWDVRGALPLAYAQRIDGSGAAQWATDGIALGAGSGAQYLQGLVADSSGGAIAVWMDARGSSWDLYAQRLAADGTPLWGAGGLPVCTQDGLQDGVVLASDGVGGALVAWQDARVAPGEIYAQKISAAGNLVWADGGVVEAQPSLELAAAEPGVARLVWWVGTRVARATVYRTVAGGAWEVVAVLAPDGTGRVRYEDRAVVAGARYGYRVGLAGSAGETLIGETWLEIPLGAELALMGLRPNPATRELNVAFSLRDGSPARLELLDVAGRCVVVREVGGLGAGAHVVRLGDERAVAAGVYWLRLTQRGEVVVRRGSVVR